MIPVKNLPPSNLHLTVASTPLTGLNILRGWLTASPPHPSAPLAWFWMRFRHTGQALGFLASSVMHPWFPDPPNLEVFEFWGPSQWSKKKTTMLVDSVHSLMCSFRTPFFMRGIHTSNIIFPLAVDQKNVFSIFFLRTFPSESPSNLRKALHDDKASTSHCVAGSNKWRKGAPEDRNLQVGGIFADLGFLGLGDKGDKKGMLILQTQRLLTKIIQNRENLLIHFKLKILIFILHPILHTPPKKKKELGPHPNVVPRYLSHLSDVAIGQQPGHCESVVPGVQTSAAPREAQASLLQVGKPSLRLQSQYPVNKTRQPPQHFYQTHVILRKKTSLSIILLHS